VATWSFTEWVKDLQRCDLIKVTGKEGNTDRIEMIKRQMRGIHEYGCRCSERLKAKARGCEILAHTRWNGGMGYLRSPGGRRYESRGLPVSGRIECVEDVTDLRFDL
jgi:hypothetical protein